MQRFGQNSPSFIPSYYHQPYTVYPFPGMRPMTMATAYGGFLGACEHLTNSSFVAETTCFEVLMSPVVKQTTQPPPVACDRCNARSGWSSVVA